ncbi:MAG TPA: tripartite tricarboxylate transporter substrate binding protein [Pseudolabrys sp.]|nr:tripartite tricarboxylate transporter substrate binding protein [Pseudolabrys sp.]
MKRWTHAALAGIALACLALAAPAALAQAPGGTIRIIVPFAPAGSSDVLARVLQGPLQEELKQTVIVENHAGAGSNLGTVEVARAHPDGNTFLITSSAFVVNPALYKNVPYKFDTDFAPISLLPVAPNVFAVNPAKSGINSVADMVKRAKDKPASLNYSSPGNGTTPQLTMELFKLKLGVDLTNIPYGGGGPATQALLGGTVDVLSTALPGAQAQIKGGTMKGIALTTSERWPMLPDVPTFKEVGYPDMSLDTEHFLLAPAGTPLAVIERMSKAAQATLAREDVKKRLVELGYLNVGSGPAEAKERIAKDVAFYKKLIADAKIPQIQ